LDELTGAIDALRGFPSDHARAAGVELRPHEGFGHPSQRELHRRHAAELGSEAVARVEALWRGYENGPHHQHTVPDALAHADLKPEHILHDPTSGQITAVLDWGDACLSQADFDLAVIGLFFDDRVRDELADRLPNVNAQQVARDAELLVAVRWLCDLDVGAAGAMSRRFRPCASRACAPTWTRWHESAVAPRYRQMAAFAGICGSLPVRAVAGVVVTSYDSPWARATDEAKRRRQEL
jgi:Ser/Thr protein kinase RdoA (MazF antagonist)